MKFKQTFFVICTSFCIIFSLKAQIHLSGNLNSSVYAWENLQETQNTDFYQGVQFRAFHEKYSNLQLNTFFRFARNGDPAEWNEKIYNAYIKWKSPDNKYGVKLGRQFLYYGVLNGTVDGMLFSYRLLKGLDVKLLAGTAPSVNKDFVIKHWDRSSALGFYSSYTFSNGFKLNASYFKKSKELESVWEQIGTSLSGKLMCNLFLNARFDYNLNTSNYQTMRYRLTYFMNKWTFSGEFNSQKPRVYEDSYFKIFEIEPYNQVRTGIAYQFGDYQIGLRYLLTMYEDDNNNQGHLTFANKWGLIGFVYQNGYAGDNAGLFGEIRYNIMQNLSLFVHSSYNKYQRQSVVIDEEALSFLGRIKYQILDDLDIQIEARDSQNSYFKNDLRGLFRLNYRFNHIL